jgi:LPS O-antigen subunit length determinant protein (WzzB/FepE family)
MIPIDPDDPKINLLDALAILLGVAFGAFILLAIIFAI